MPTYCTDPPKYPKLAAALAALVQGRAAEERDALLASAGWLGRRVEGKLYDQITADVLPRLVAGTLNEIDAAHGADVVAGGPTISELLKLFDDHT
jgi:hypothetical protein